MVNRLTHCPATNLEISDLRRRTEALLKDLDILYIKRNPDDMDSVIGVEPSILIWETWPFLVGMIIRSPMGCLNGYVSIDGVSTVNPSEFLSVHGGVTYEGVASFLPESCGYKDSFVLGFDTAHSGDLLVLQNFMYPNNLGGTYRDLSYVINEVERLAEQIASW